MPRLSMSDKAILFSVYHEFRVSPNPPKSRVREALRVLKARGLELAPSVNTVKLWFEKWDANGGNFTVGEDRQHTSRKRKRTPQIDLEVAECLAKTNSIRKTALCKWKKNKITDDYVPKYN